MRAIRKTSRRRSTASVIVVFDVLLMLFTVGSLMYTYMASGMAHVPEITGSQMAFWERRASELCVEPDKRPRLKWPPADADPIIQLAFLNDQAAQYQKIWELYKGCQEPKSESIPEDVLHFKVDKYDEFESDPATGFQTIRSYVDQYIKTHKLIYVVGHTDETFTDEYNNLLSYRRALRVVDEIKNHLTRRRLQAGKDYSIYPVGMGEMQLLKPKSSEGLAEWHKRCRRIDIDFRAGRPTDATAGK